MKKQNITVISSFPRKGEIHSQNLVGIASYAKNTLLSLKKFHKGNIEVLAETVEDEDSYKEKGIIVKRVWERNSISIFPKLLSEINKSKSDKILIEFELAMFGNMLYLLPFPLFLLMLKLQGKKIYIVLHQVIKDINDISGHINLRKDSSKSIVLNFGIRTFYKILAFAANKIIVFDQVLEDNFEEITGSKNVVVIPHGIELFNKKLNKQLSRKKLGIKKNKFVILLFGFVAWYKGTDLLIHLVKKQLSNGHKKDFELVIAGGPNPNHLDKAYYRRYLRSIENECKKNGFIFTGFVPEKQIPYYFQASDLVVLPYRTLMSASGPLSLALSFKKPFLLSKTLKGVLNTKDFEAQLLKNKIKPENLYFESEKDFKTKVTKFKKNLSFRKKIAALSSSISRERNWNNIGKAYYEELL